MIMRSSRGRCALGQMIMGVRGKHDDCTETSRAGVSSPQICLGWRHFSQTLCLSRTTTSPHWRFACMVICYDVHAANHYKYVYDIMMPQRPCKLLCSLSLRAKFCIISPQFDSTWISNFRALRCISTQLELQTNISCRVHNQRESSYQAIRTTLLNSNRRNRAGTFTGMLPPYVHSVHGPMSCRCV